MTSDYRRNVVGYPDVEFNVANVTLIQNAFVEVSLGAGPGELYGMGIWSWNTNNARYVLLRFKLTIDGVDIYDGSWADFLALKIDSFSVGLFSQNSYPDAVDQSSSFLSRMSYASTCKLKWTNLEATAIAFILSVLSRRGA